MPSLASLASHNKLILLKETKVISQFRFGRTERCKLLKI